MFDEHLYRCTAAFSRFVRCGRPNEYIAVKFIKSVNSLRWFGVVVNVDHTSFLFARSNPALLNFLLHRELVSKEGEQFSWGRPGTLCMVHFSRVIFRWSKSSALFTC
jgi:hypothetical protein